MSSLNVSSLDSLSKEIGSLYLSETCADVYFIVENERLPAHKPILAARSSYFRALLFGNMNESYQDEIMLRIPVNYLKLLLHFIYTGNVSIPIANALDFLEIVNQFGFEEIENSISKHFEDNLCRENVVEAFNASHRYFLNDLQSGCFKFIMMHLEDIINSGQFEKLSESALMQILEGKLLVCESVIHRALSNWLEQQDDKSNNFVTDYLENNCLNKDNHGILIENVAGDAEINHFKFTSMDTTKVISYFIECSNNKIEWNRILDYSGYPCSSTQNLYIPTSNFKFVNVVGVGCELNLRHFDMSFSPTVPMLLNGIICPTKNVAHLKEGAWCNHPELIDGNFTNYTDHVGFSTHALTRGEHFLVRLNQPYIISSLRLRLWDLMYRFYRYYIQYSVDNKTWKTIVDTRGTNSFSWQNFSFKPALMMYIKIVGTLSGPDRGYLHIVHFECPSQDFTNIVQLN